RWRCARVKGRGLEGDAAPDRGAPRALRVGRVNAIWIVDMRHVRAGVRGLSAAAIGEAARVAQGVLACAQVELVEFRQRTETQERLRVRIALAIDAWKRIERANFFPDVF